MELIEDEFVLKILILDYNKKMSLNRADECSNRYIHSATGDRRFNRIEWGKFQIKFGNFKEISIRYPDIKHCLIRMHAIGVTLWIHKIRDWNISAWGFEIACRLRPCN